jgi:glycosyltransferase involved in cell wall biosynthesis
MKILYLITQSELGGAQSYVLDLVSSLNKQHEIIVGFGEQGNNGELAKKLSESGVACHGLPHLIRAISPVSDTLALIEIIRLIKRIQPDIVHLNSSKISILGSLSALACHLLNRKKQTKYIYTVHGWVFNEPLSLWKKLFYKYAEKYSSFIKTRLICVSDYDRGLAIKNHIAPLEKLTTIHNGRKPIDFLSRGEARKKLQKLFPIQKISDNEIIIGTIANFYKTKGYEYFLSAISRLIIEGVKLRVVAIGEGPERNNIEKMIKAYRLEDSFLLTGQLDGAKLLKAFDIYVCSSVKEGLSYTIIEAMQAELPIIATKVGGNPELITNGLSGQLVESQDAEALAKEINNLLRDPDLGKTLGKNARTKAIKDFGLERMIEMTEKVYLE